jgi:predicted ATPase
MLTHLEVDGFKNLLEFTEDFGPYTCIAGPNSVGKSNIFDAIEFLSLLADKTFVEAAAAVRATEGGPSDPGMLFFDDGTGRPRQMRLVAEMIVPREVTDDFGRQAVASTSYLRYELLLEYTAPAPSGPFGRTGGIRLARESLTNLRAGDANGNMPWMLGKKAFRDAVIINKRRAGPLIHTDVDGDVVTVSVHQEGNGGRPQKSNAHDAPRTAVSTVTTIDSPTILAVRNEMRRWRMLALEPSAMRQPDEVTAPAVVSASGAHLAAALLRMGAADKNALSQVAAAASALTDVRNVRVDFDERRELLTLLASIGSGPEIPARNLSDGTLRFLALCIMAADPEYSGVICMEEPENGIHPARIQAMVELVRELSVDPDEAPSVQNPMRQVIVNTHSPAFVRKQDKDDLVLALSSTVTRNNRAATTVRLHAMVGSWRAGKNDSIAMTKSDVIDYLRNSPGDQLALQLGAQFSADEEVDD